MTKRWYKFGTVTHENGTEYTTWQDWNGIFQVTKGECPSPNDGGYHDLVALLGLKGLNVNRHRSEIAGL